MSRSKGCSLEKAWCFVAKCGGIGNLQNACKIMLSLIQFCASVSHCFVFALGSHLMEKNERANDFSIKQVGYTGAQSSLTLPANYTNKMVKVRGWLTSSPNVLASELSIFIYFCTRRFLSVCVTRVGNMMFYIFLALFTELLCFQWSLSCSCLSQESCATKYFRLTFFVGRVVFPCSTILL